MQHLNRGMDDGLLGDMYRAGLHQRGNKNLSFQQQSGFKVYVFGNVEHQLQLRESRQRQSILPRYGDNGGASKHLLSRDMV